MMLLLAQAFSVPTSASVYVGGLVVIALLTVGAIFAALRQFRSNLADELKRELTTQAAAQSVNIQSPLKVETATRFTTKEEHEKLAKKIDEELGRERSARKGIYEKIDAQSQRLTRVEEKTDFQTRQLHTLDGKIDRVLERLPPKQ